ncbi:MAG: pantoate--beta-alanine ligase [Dehalococcoidales bacterium]
MDIAPVKVVATIPEMRQRREMLPEPVGFVPTMGYLHEGHLALVREARASNSSVVVSIFVNPAQFGPQEDFANYPRDTDRDLALLAGEKADIIFIPSAGEMYPDRYGFYIDGGPVTERLEGTCRPGHFRGVNTIVGKLFNIVKPTRAYFGQKDAQQAVVIRKMVADLNMDVEIVTSPTVREEDGLAMSSRNAYLNQEERRTATVLYRALCLAEQHWQSGEEKAGRVRQKMTELIEAEPLASIDYVSIADTDTLEEMEAIRPPALVSLAVRIGKTRLIDNIVIG